MQYQIFVVSERVYNSLHTDTFFQGGIVVDGLIDHDNQQFLIVVRYQQKKEKRTIEAID